VNVPENCVRNTIFKSRVTKIFRRDENFRLRMTDKFNSDKMDRA